MGWWELENLNQLSGTYNPTQDTNQHKGVAWKRSASQSGSTSDELLNLEPSECSKQLPCINAPTAFMSARPRGVEVSFTE
jgi:hypothetical protein